MSATAALLFVTLVLFGVSIVLLIVDVLRSPGLSPAARAGWTAAFVVGSFFTAVLWFAQGRTGKPGRLGSVVMVVAIGTAIAVIVVKAVEVLRG